MQRSSLIVALFLVGMFAGVRPIFADTHQSAKPTARVHKKSTQKTEAELPPPAPLTPEQQPAQVPQVSYLNGQLTIIASNSTLGDILNAVKTQTGADIEVPAGASERIAGRMGPGPARDVIAQLLNGSQFDYVMVASSTNPGGIEHLMLTPKTAGGETPPPQTASAAPTPQPQPDPSELSLDTNAAADDGGQDIFSQDPPQAQPDENANAEAQQQAQPQPGQPFFQQQFPQQQQPGQEGANGQNPFQPQQPPTGAAPQGFPDQQQIKTPQQLLQEIQQQQQLQQQQQQNGPDPD